METVKHIHFLGLEFTFVLRHRWENDLVSDITRWNRWEIGLWYKKSKVVTKIDRQAIIPEEKLITIDQYMFGLKLLICHVWFTVNKNYALKIKSQQHGEKIQIT